MLETGGWRKEKKSSTAMENSLFLAQETFQTKAMKESGKMTVCRDMERITTLTDLYIMVSGKVISIAVGESCSQQMERNTMDNGKSTLCMVKESTQITWRGNGMVILDKENSKVEVKTC